VATFEHHGDYVADATPRALRSGLSSLQAVLGGMAGLHEDNLLLTYYHELMTVDFSYPDTNRTARADISLDGADLRRFDVDELRRHMMEALA